MYDIESKPVISTDVSFYEKVFDSMSGYVSKEQNAFTCFREFHRDGQYHSLIQHNFVLCTTSHLSSLFQITSMNFVTVE